MNASCASGIFLGACVYQCLLTHPSPPGAVVVFRKRDYCCLFKRGGGVWALPVHTHGHPPKSRPACQTTFVPTIATLDLVSLGLVRCGCGKSVTRHHRQRDGSRRMPASTLWSCEHCSAGPRARPLRHTTLRPSSPNHSSHERLPLDLMHTRGPAEFKHIIKRRKRN